MLRPKWNPPADLYRTPQGWALKLDLAGVRPEDVEVELKGRDLSVTGARRDWLVREGWRHYSMEIQYDRFERLIRLPEGLEKAKLTRDFKDGMLLIQFKTREGGHHG
jgi:HSP20 family protein